MDRVYYSYCIDATSAQMVYAELVKNVIFHENRRLLNCHTYFTFWFLGDYWYIKASCLLLPLEIHFHFLHTSNSLVKVSSRRQWYSVESLQVMRRCWFEGFANSKQVVCITSFDCDATVWNLVNTRNIINRIFIVLNHLNTIDSTYE